MRGDTHCTHNCFDVFCPFSVNNCKILGKNMKHNVANYIHDKTMKMSLSIYCQTSLQNINKLDARCCHSRGKSKEILHYSVGNIQ